MPTLEQTKTMTTMHHAPVTRAEPRAASFVLAVSCALAGAALLWASYFPLNWGWCAWFALVPLLVLVRAKASGRVIYGSAMIAGYAFAVTALKWMRVAHPMMVSAWLALAFYCALYFPLAVWLLRRLERLRLPMALTVPIVWVSLEYLRGHFLTGFTWYFLGHTQHDYLPVIQVADLGGVYAVSFLVAAVNGLIFDVTYRWSELRSRLAMPVPLPGRMLVLAAGATGVLLAAALGYGFWRLNHSEFAEGPRVTLLQSNIPQNIKNNRGDDGQEGQSARSFMVQHTSELTDKIVMQRLDPDLIIWPETSCPMDWLAIHAETPQEQVPEHVRENLAWCHEVLGFITKRSRTHVLLGLNSEQFHLGARSNVFNSALLVHRDGRELGRYDKIHCVPFGEYVPMRESLPWMQMFAPYDHDYSLKPGENLTRFTLPTARGDYRFGVLICYEDSEPMLARGYARQTEDGPPVDFLVNISNDGWFDGTEEHELHLAICRFRAVEARRAVVRAVNMGISAVIDANGRLIALPGPTWGESKKVAGTVTATVPIDSRVSPYARAGDWLAVACAAGCAALTGATLRRKFGGTVNSGMAGPSTGP